mgnify:CR=1 FL=1
MDERGGRPEVWVLNVGCLWFFFVLRRCGLFLLPAAVRGRGDTGIQGGARGDFRGCAPRCDQERRQEGGAVQ